MLGRERWGVLGRLRRSFGQNMECFGVHNWGILGGENKQKYVDGN